MVDNYEYKCPNCNGEFNSWEGGLAGTKSCPFCGQEKGNYGGYSL